jgi:hypothetical protein
VLEIGRRCVWLPLPECVIRAKAATDSDAIFDPGFGWFDPKQARGLGALDTAPELPLGSDNQVLIKRISVGGNLDEREEDAGRPTRWPRPVRAHRRERRRSRGAATKAASEEELTPGDATTSAGAPRYACSQHGNMI